MFEILSTFFKKNKIDSFAPLPLDECRILRPYLLERAGIDSTGTAVLFAVPYLAKEAADAQRNLSLYACACDYHLFFQSLFEGLLPRLREAFPENTFVGFADHSPIDEVHAAARAGLGVIGENRLLITPRHSSFVFLGEIITDIKLPATVYDIGTCQHCGACRKACPAGEGLPCLSSLTQKKGKLTQKEADYIAAYQSVWGCDICQEVCPHTVQAKRNGTLYTEIPYFCENTLPYLTGETLDGMTEDAFSKRAYAWRGREVVERNLRIVGKGEKSC
ncbi:MAG: epoxyqueuosine reductase [Ruminococcaceae bacterium]|nr:epoxyqueuosine reductase [Oscillospiraceae bacterium]